MSGVVLSDEQRQVLSAILDWIAHGSEQMTSVGGYAGTGKTTLIRELVEILGSRAKPCAYTGKAAHGLRRKGVLTASTIHSSIYEPAYWCAHCERWVLKDEDDPRARPKCPRGRKHTVLLRFRRARILPWDYMIVDEASMVSQEVFDDLTSYATTRVIFVGDHGQLEPIGDNPNIMRHPIHRLETIHRQAAGSPIIQFAHHVRAGNRPKTFGDEARMRRGIPNDLHTFDQVICGFNNTRVAVNRKIRKQLGYDGEIPLVGERVVCLRNNRDHMIFNGMQGTVVSICALEQRLTVEDDAGFLHEDMPFAPAQFGAEGRLDDVAHKVTLWDFGYCLTVHKAQGSEFDKLLVLEQIASSWSRARWSYTAATRAAKELVYCVR